MNPSEMSNDQIAEAIRALLVEAESRLEAQNMMVALGLVRGAHAALEKAATRVANSGAIQPMSVGGDKD